MNTREFKQQQEALHSLERQAQTVSAELEQRQREEEALRERLQSFERQAQEAEKTLSEQSEIPKASMLNYKSALETAQEIIERQKKALADRGILTAKNEKQQEEIHSLRETVTALNEKYKRSESERQQEQERSTTRLMEQMKTNNNLFDRLEEVEAFFRWNTTAGMMRDEYEREKQQEAQRKAAEERQRKWEAEQRERQRQEEQARQAKELEQQKALELERQREERELAKARSLKKRPRGKGMSL